MMNHSPSSIKPERNPSPKATHQENISPVNQATVGLQQEIRFTDPEALNKQTKMAFLTVYSGLILAGVGGLYTILKPVIDPIIKSILPPGK